MNKLQDIIKECCVRNIPVSIVYNKKEERLEYEISGFYKSDNVKLYMDEKSDIICKGRYDITDTIDSFQDLVGVNYYWWNTSKDRYDGWINPDNYWINSLIEFSYIKKKETVVVSYEKAK